MGKAGCHGVLDPEAGALVDRKARCHGVLSRGWSRMSWCTPEAGAPLVDRKARCHGVLSRGWRWERQDVMVNSKISSTYREDLVPGITKSLLYIIVEKFIKLVH